MRHASFLFDELLYSVRPDNGSDQVPLVGPRVLFLHCLFSPASVGELVMTPLTFISTKRYTISTSNLG